MLNKVKYFIVNITVIWGGFSVDNPTLNRFFSLHFLIPFIIAALACAHLIALHLHGFKGLKFIRNLHFILPNPSEKNWSSFF